AAWPGIRANSWGARVRKSHGLSRKAAPEASAAHQRDQRSAALLNAVAARLQAGRDGTPILLAAGWILSGSRATPRLGGFEAGLVGRPAMAFVAILRLLILALTILWIDVELVLPARAGGRARRRRRARSRRIDGRIGARGRLDDLVGVRRGIPAIVNVIGVVIRHAAEVHRRIERRQH